MFSKAYEFFGEWWNEVKIGFAYQTRPMSLYCNANLGLPVPFDALERCKIGLFLRWYAMARFFFWVF